MSTDHATVGQYVKVTVHGRSFVGEVVANDNGVLLLDGPVSVVSVPTAKITKVEVAQ